MAMLVHGTRSVSVPTGSRGFAGAFPKVGEEVKFYTPEELEEMRANKETPVSTWPGKKESSSEDAPADPETPVEPSEPEEP